MDAYAYWMWISAWLFQLVVLVAVARVVIAFRKTRGYPYWFWRQP
jgi:hypothetical protein